jgi:hypothetical protein
VLHTAAEGILCNMLELANRLCIAAQRPDAAGWHLDPTVTGRDYRLAYELMHWSKGPERRALPGTATTRRPLRGTLHDGLTRLVRMAGVLANTDDLLYVLAVHLKSILTSALQSHAPVALEMPHEPPPPSRMSFMMDQIRRIGAFSSLDADGGGAAEPMWRTEVFQAVLQWLVFRLQGLCAEPHLQGPSDDPQPRRLSLEDQYEDRPGELGRLQAALELEMVERIKAVQVVLEHTAAEALNAKQAAPADTAASASAGEGMEAVPEGGSQGKGRSESEAEGQETAPADLDPREVPAEYVLSVKACARIEPMLSNLERERPEAVQHLSEGLQALTAAMGVELSPAVTALSLTALLGLMEVCMRTLVNLIDVEGSPDCIDESELEPILRRGRASATIGIPRQSHCRRGGADYQSCYAGLFRLRRRRRFPGRSTHQKPPRGIRVGRFLCSGFFRRGGQLPEWRGDKTSPRGLCPTHHWTRGACVCEDAGGRLKSNLGLGAGWSLR